MTPTQEGPARSWLGWLGWLPASISRLRRDPPPEQVSLVSLSAVALGIATGGILYSRNVFTPSLLAVVLLFGGLVLSRRGMIQLAAVVGLSLAGLITYIVNVPAKSPSRPFGLIVVALLAFLIAYEFARSRDETGMAGMRADSMLVELRSRLEDAGRIPPLPARWQAELVIKPAGGGPFAGDFVVSHVEGDRLEIVLADVSGKGVEAGTRALLLSGALGGLLGTKDFLGAANSYLMRQDWTEGFATAAHVVLDLETGGYDVSSAGHPPVVHFDAGKGLWGKLDAEGPALGLLPDIGYQPCSGQLRPGDALLLYTDGLVEVPGRDLDVGIDKLLGEAEALVTRGFAGGGEVLVNRVSAGSTDDRGLILLWRSPHQ